MSFSLHGVLHLKFPAPERASADFQKQQKQQLSACKPPQRFKQEVLPEVRRGRHHGGGVPGGGAAARDAAPALLHPGTRRLERHRRPAGSHMQGNPQPAEGSSVGGTG